VVWDADVEDEVEAEIDELDEGIEADDDEDAELSEELVEVVLEVGEGLELLVVDDDVDEIAAESVVKVELLLNRISATSLSSGHQTYNVEIIGLDGSIILYMRKYYAAANV
jgi:hypothetical protein